jgi:zinc ribbon protein/Sel1 repeat-containing protein
MLETMYVRCTHCGYDNSPEYRFCGMCGAALAHPQVPAKPSVREVAAVPKPSNGSAEADKRGPSAENVHGPSFLGLSEDPKTEFHYLYEDEPPRSYAGLFFVMILLAAIGGAGYWQWKHHGFPFNRFGAGQSAQQSASPSEVAPAQSQEQQTHIDRPMTGSGDVLPTQPDQTKPADSGKSTEFPSEGGQTAPPQGAAVANNPPTDQSATATQTPPEKPAEEAKATPPPIVSASPKKPSRTPTPKAAAKVAPPPAPKTSADAELETAGERYLYGTGGTPQNCAKAESSLRTAAMHGNGKAQAVLGTMYYTGHCVSRDLPAAYRWFARALRQDPQNSTLSSDLQVLWRQMSTQERQLATTNAQ